MKKVFSLVMAVLLVAAALPALADHGQYMQDNVGYAQKGLPGVLERFDGDLDAVAAYLTSPTANNQGGGPGKRTDLDVVVKVAKPAEDDDQETGGDEPDGSSEFPWVFTTDDEGTPITEQIAALFGEGQEHEDSSAFPYYFKVGEDVYKVTKPDSDIAVEKVEKEVK